MQSRFGRQKHILSTSRIGFGIGALVILIAIIFNGFIASVLSGFVELAINPSSSVYENVPRAILASRLQNAEDELSRIRYQGLLYTLEVEKNLELMQSLGLPGKEVSGRGRVFVRPPRTHYDTLLVSLSPGTEIVVGDQAYASGILVGEVSEVDNEIAQVSLYSSPGAVLDVRVGEPSAIVVMRGLGGGSFFLEVPKEVALTEGDTVLLSQSDVLVSLVQRIIDEPEQTTFKVYAASPINNVDMRIIEFVKHLPVPEEE